MSSGVIGLLILAVCVVLWVTEWLPAVVTGAIGCLAFVLFKLCDLSVAFSGKTVAVRRQVEPTDIVTFSLSSLISVTSIKSIFSFLQELATINIPPRTIVIVKNNNLCFIMCSFSYPSTKLFFIGFESYK